MLTSIGLAVNSDHEYWIKAIRSCQSVRVTVTQFGAPPPSPVDVWLVVPPAAPNLQSWSGWLGQLQAPILLVTGHLAAGAQLAGALPRLKMVCHPLRAESRPCELLYLASRVSSGVVVLGAPGVRLVERAAVQYRSAAARRRSPPVTRATALPGDTLAR